MPARKPKTDEKPQSERFVETAREIGTDETQEAFERVFDAVVKGNLKNADTPAKKIRVRQPNPPRAI